MSELSEYFRERYTKNDNSSAKDIMSKQRVKNTIINLCDEYLKDADDELTFEVLDRELENAVIVINEEPIKSRYFITQISNSLFTARLQEIEIGI